MSQYKDAWEAAMAVNSGLAKERNVAQQALAAERERAIEWQTFSDNVRVDLAAANERVKNWEQRYRDVTAHNERLLRELAAERERGDKWKGWFHSQCDRLALFEDRCDAANERADDLRRRLADKEKAFSDVVIEADMIANDRRDELRRANERAERAEVRMEYYRKNVLLLGETQREVERLKFAANQTTVQLEEAVALVCKLRQIISHEVMLKIAADEIHVSKPLQKRINACFV